MPKKLPPNKPIDPSVIDFAPTTSESQDFNSYESGKYLHLIATLADENDKLKSENERLRAKESIEDVKTRLLEPYSWAVFYFVGAYCFFVGFILVLAGFGGADFKLPTPVLSIISGSTAVSVIGLVGLVISGLFSTRRNKIK